MEVKNKKIAFFDSGVGGLTVFAKMKKRLPNEDYLYFGDLKNSPYGAKDAETLIGISKKIFDYFKKRDVKAVIMACNTTSATAYYPLKDKYDFKIYPIIQSCAKSISELNVSRVCVFATDATVKTHAYKNYINKYNPTINVLEIACPTWVKIVEENRVKECADEVKIYVDKIGSFNPDKVILGCTHFPYLKEEMSKYIPNEKIIDPADIFVEYIISDLTENSLLKGGFNESEEILVSANEHAFAHAAGMFYKLQKIPKKIEI